jgi:cytochrome c-type biogenesis protein CcmH/NrfF
VCLTKHLLLQYSQLLQSKPLKHQQPQNNQPLQSKLHKHQHNLLLLSKQLKCPLCQNSQLL